MADDYMLATLQAYRIASSTLIYELLVEVFGKDGAAADRFDRMQERIITSFHGMALEGVGAANAEFVRQHILHALDDLSHVASDIRARLAERGAEPN